MFEILPRVHFGFFYHEGCGICAPAFRECNEIYLCSSRSLYRQLYFLKQYLLPPASARGNWVPPYATLCCFLQILGTLMKVTATSVGAGNCLDILPDFLQICLKNVYATNFLVEMFFSCWYVLFSSIPCFHKSEKRKFLIWHLFLANPTEKCTL